MGKYTEIQVSRILRKSVKKEVQKPRSFLKCKLSITGVPMQQKHEKVGKYDSG
jgi:hypothetical protein